MTAQSNEIKNNRMITSSESSHSREYGIGSMMQLAPKHRKLRSLTGSNQSNRKSQVRKEKICNFDNNFAIINCHLLMARLSPGGFCSR